MIYSSLDDEVNNDCRETRTYLHVDIEAATDHQQSQNICITFVQCWTNVEDVGPTLYKCYTSVLCLLGLSSIIPGRPSMYPEMISDI